SRTFYEALGFEATMGEPGGNWLIMRNGNHVIGLFQGLFERNTLTFNPGWNQAAEGVDSFTDIREIQRRIEEAGLTPLTRADESTTGPASIILADPDGNPIFLDQHVPAPGH
ncbi:MAG: VOC family protein, partial [Planctomycetota bacterium]